MQMPQTIEYALRAVVWLAENRETPQTTRQIAEGTRMPSSYLSKVLQGLSRSHIVSGQRGLHGGFTLVPEPDALSVLDVVNAVDPLQRVRECPLGLDGHGMNLCALHRLLDDTLATVEQTFAETSIGALLDDSNPSRPLCDMRSQTSATLTNATAKKT